MIAKKRHYGLTLWCRFAIFNFRYTRKPCFLWLICKKLK